MPRASPNTIAQALSLYLAFTPWSEIARITGIKQNTLERRAQREGWPNKRGSQPAVVDFIEPDCPNAWVGAVRQECETALKRIQTYPLPTDIASERQRVSLIGQLDEIARRAYGIDKAGNALTVNLNYMRDQPKLVQNAECKVIDVGITKPNEA